MEEAAYYRYLEEGLADDGLMDKYVEVMVRRAHSRRYRHKNEPQLQRAEATDEN